MFRISCLIALLLLVISCRRPHEETRFYHAIHQSLQSSNAELAIESWLSYEEGELRNRHTGNQAWGEVWGPRQHKVMILSQTALSYIEELKNKIQAKATGKNGFAEDSRSSVSEVFTPANRQQLNTTLQNYAAVFRGEFARDTTQKFFQAIAQLEMDRMQFNENIEGKTAMEALVVLSLLQNKIRIAEIQASRYCLDHNRMIIEDYSSFALLVTQNMGTLRPGEVLEIKAGMGRLDTSGHPEFRINGAKLPLDEIGTVHYRVKVQGKSGNYSLPLELSFTNNKGELKTYKQDIQYRIVD